MKPGKMGVLLSAALLTVTALGTARGAEPLKPAGPQPLSLDEARRTVRLMNDIYVHGVLITHKMYASEAGTAAAVAWGKQVIREINRKGWPKARIFGSSAKILNPENQPVDDFEREAAAAFGKGKTEFEKTVAGKYRYAIPLTVSEESCLNCHVRNKKGDLLGGVSYEAVLK